MQATILAVPHSIAASCMSARRYSLDTNVLIYSVDQGAGVRHQQAIALVEKMAGKECLLTLQSLSEFFSAAIRKGKMPVEAAKGQVEDWMALFPVAAADAAVVTRAMESVEKRQFSYWDAMLVETAVRAGVNCLYSEDMQHGQIWRGMEIINPFMEECL